MNVCFHCEKTSDYGHLVSHAKNRVAHTRKPNLHRAHLLVNGTMKNVRLCTSCIRTYRASQLETKKAN